MVTKSLWARLQAKPEKAEEVAKFLAGAVAMANQEERTVVWFALRIDKTTFAIFDAFADDRGRQAHLDGPIAKALMARAGELLAAPPSIEQVDVLAAKLH
jgi:quinol monooxygenase YgiN